MSSFKTACTKKGLYTKHHTRILTRIEEENALEASQLHPVHIEVVQPVGQLTEYPEENTSDLGVLDVVLAASEPVGQQHRVRFRSVLGSQLQSAVLAPAGLQQLDLIVKTQAAESRDPL